MFAFVITYSFDSDYVAHLCNTREEAETLLRKYLYEEYEIVKLECEYEPIIRIIECSEDYQILWYTEHGSEVGKTGTDFAEYRVFDLSRNYMR